MRRTAAIVVLLALAAAATAAHAGRLALAPGDRAPVKLSGKLHPQSRQTSVAWAEHDFTLVNFWATWCEPCKVEMPELQKLKDRYGERLQVVGAYDQTIDSESIAQYLDAGGVSFPVFRIGRSEDEVWGGIGAIPTTFLIRRDGIIVRRYVGATPKSTAGLVADVEAAMEGRKLGPMVLPDPDEETTTGFRRR